MLGILGEASCAGPIVERASSCRSFSAKLGLSDVLSRFASGGLDEWVRWMRSTLDVEDECVKLPLARLLAGVDSSVLETDGLC